MSVLALYETRYFDFTVKHFHEKLPEHGVSRSYSWTKNVLQGVGRVARAKRRGAHRRKRAPAHDGDDAAAGRLQA